MIHTRWVQLDDSYFYLVCSLPAGWQRAEWEVVGEVQYRQIYSAVAPTYFVVLHTTGGKRVANPFASVERAKEEVETYAATLSPTAG